MMEMTIELLTQRVIGMLAEYADIPPDHIFPTSSPSHDLNLDSLDLVVLAQSFEEEFEIAIEDEEWEKARTVAQVCELIMEKLEQEQEQEQEQEKQHVK